jgi:Tol biopolymer transport system component
VGDIAGSQRRAVGIADSRSEREPVGKEKKNNYAFDPVWSPDGGRIAFVHTSTTTLPHIWSIGADGKKLRQETHGSLVDLSPDWGTPPA